MKSISVFDIIKIGIGPSSSHTMGPWKASTMFLEWLKTKVKKVEEINIYLYGSLAKTGIGHGTDIAVLLGLSGEDYTQINPQTITTKIDYIKKNQQLLLGGKYSIYFEIRKNIHFLKKETLEFHPNGMLFKAKLKNGEILKKEYFSVGGGFVVDGEENTDQVRLETKYPCHTGQEIENRCKALNLSIPQLILLNEQAWQSEVEIKQQALHIWEEITACIYRGINTRGILPGGLSVKRRASIINKKILGEVEYANFEEWVAAIRNGKQDFTTVNKWVSVFAMAVNEENASLGRIITAPTNGASGVMPAVMLYAYCFLPNFNKQAIVDFILIAGEIGTLYKKKATISAAMGGCQAEIGVSSSMSAGALAYFLGATTKQTLQAAEIAMEHHLGLTCDPIGGLVQIPCIERNSMGAIKAITAANMAIEDHSGTAKISLDDVIASMWETAQDMNHKYKETSEGGLAKIAVSIPEC